MAHVSSQPTGLSAKSKVQAQRQYGVFAQVANETCTFDRYVSLTALYHVSRCLTARQEVDFSAFSEVNALAVLGLCRLIGTRWSFMCVRVFYLFSYYYFLGGFVLELSSVALVQRVFA